MGIEKGNFEQNHRYDSINEAYIYERVDAPGEEHIAVLLEGLGGRVGFLLTEIPVLDTENPTVVTRINVDLSEDIFDEINIAPSTDQFKINYLQEDSIVYLPASEVGNKFRVQYTCKGTGQNVENIKALMRSTIEFNTGLSGKFKKANLYDKVVNAANVYLLGKRATVRNCLVQGSSVIRGNVEGKTSFFEVYGDLTLERDSITEMSGVILIVHGSLKVTGVGDNPIIKGFDGVPGTLGEMIYQNAASQSGGYGGNGGYLIEMTLDIGRGAVGSGGSGSYGTKINLLGTIIYYPPGVGGAAGLPNGSPGQNGHEPVVDDNTTWLGGGATEGVSYKQGNRLFGSGWEGISSPNGVRGIDYGETSGPGYGSGGNGGPCGGAGIIIICFGDLDPDIDFVMGKGLNGSQSGSFTLISKYSSLPNVIDVTPDTDGVSGNIEFINITERSDANESILNEFGFNTVGSINI